MRAVVQRVKRAKVTVEGRETGSIEYGILLLLGIGGQDEEKDLNYIFDKTINLRIFEDDQGKMNRSLLDIGGQLLVVSQFTLHGDCRKGRRPSFTAAAPADKGNDMYDQFVRLAKNAGITTATGEFGAMMDVELVNSGPVTLLLDSEKTF